MTFNHQLVDKILEAIFPLPDNFGVILLEDEEATLPNDIFNELQNSLWAIDPDINICYGLSKLVITSFQLGNIVIKIPFNGFFSWKYDVNEYDDFDNLLWNPFRWASGSDHSDYCLTEYEKYRKLKTYGLDCFVAKVMFYKEMCGVRIFLQEKIIPKNNLYYTKKPSKKSQDLANKWYDEGKFYLDTEWIANCLDKYGKSKVERFLYYCANIDLDILEDAHNGNFGYRNNETPVILDYSNYLD